MTPTPTLRSVAVTCDPTTLTSTGQTAACRATAILSDGTTQNQTSAATWSSSNSSVASVSSSGVVTARDNGTATITASYQNVQGTATVTVNVPLSMTRYTANISWVQVGFGWRTTGTINITLSRAITSPVPSRVRAEWENSLVGGSTTYTPGATQLTITVNQDTVARPNFSNTPTDYLRLIDVDRQVILARGVFQWN